MKSNSKKTEKDFSSNIARNSIIFAGVGIFIYLSVNLLGELISNVCERILISLNVDFYMCFWLIELFTFVIKIGVFFVLLEKIKIRFYRSKIKLFYFFVIVYFTLGVIQFVNSYFIIDFFSDDYFINANNFYDYLNERPYLQIISYGKDILVIIALILIIMFNLKKSQNTIIAEGNQLKE